MRGWRLPGLALLVIVLLAGCTGIGDEDLDQAATATEIDTEALEVPENAELEPTEEGVRLVFQDVELPLEQEIEIPEGTEMVRVSGHHAEGEATVLPLVREAESGAYRCLPSLARAWNVGVDDDTRCSALTAIDGDSATWRVEVYGFASFEYLVPTPVLGIPTGFDQGTAETVEVDLVEQASDGLVEDLDTEALSMPHHDIGETTDHEVESHDGAELFVEVTTPADDEHDSYPTLFISSPYNTGPRQAGERPYDDLVKDYVPRGYAVVVADVRGFGKSEGCLEVWGPNEQADQAVLVDWITDQDFSDGNVGMYGVSYPGTTPVQAAVQAPEGLEAVISIAGVLDAYQDWHFGGVPNGESIGSPLGYQTLGTSTTTQDPMERAMDQANGVCDPTLVARANDPRAVYEEYYEVRNLTARADEVEAAVMVEHGYYDVNVKSRMQVDWFNDLDVPKLGLFGEWHHQWASRADEATLRLAWMDQFVKGEDVGLADVSKASISANEDRYREAEAWPDPSAQTTSLYPDFEAEELASQPAEGEAELVLEGTDTAHGWTGASQMLPLDTMVELQTTVEDPLHVAGEAHIDLEVTLQGAENAYLAAHLFHDDGDEMREVSFGWINLAHRNGHDSYEPVPPGEPVQATLPMLPTEHTFEEGDELTLILRGVTENDWFKYRPGKPGHLVLHGGEDGTTLKLPTLGPDAWGATPTSVDTVPAK